MKIRYLAAVAGLAMLAGPATAGLVYDSTVDLSGQGFGNAPRVLTVQATGRQTSQSGCVGVNSTGGIVVGPSACIGGSDVFMSNGTNNIGGAEAQPQTDNQKFGIPTLGELGITSASDIGILFNATEPAGNGIDLLDLTLKFYSSTGALLGAIDGSQSFASTFQGNGSAGFLFRVDQEQSDYVNGLLGDASIRLALEASFANFAGGPESFALVNLGGSNPVPEPGMIGLLGLGLLGLGVIRRKSA